MSGQGAGENAVNFAIDNEADVSAGDLVVFSLRVDTSAPVYDLIMFGEDRGKADSFGKRREGGLAESTTTGGTAAGRGRAIRALPQRLQRAKRKRHQGVNLEGVAVDGRAESKDAADFLGEIDTQEASQHAAEAVANHHDRTTILSNNVVEAPA